MHDTPRPVPVPPLAVNVIINGDRVVIVLGGDIDINNADHIKSTTHHYLDQPHIIEIIADLAGVTFLDSSGLRALMLSRRRASELGKTFRIENHHGHIAKLMEITGLDKYLTDPGYDP